MRNILEENYLIISFSSCSNFGLQSHFYSTSEICIILYLCKTIRSLLAYNYFLHDYLACILMLTFFHKSGSLGPLSVYFLEVFKWSQFWSPVQNSSYRLRLFHDDFVKIFFYALKKLWKTIKTRKKKCLLLYRVNFSIIGKSRLSGGNNKSHSWNIILGELKTLKMCLCSHNLATSHPGSLDSVKVSYSRRNEEVAK